MVSVFQEPPLGTGVRSTHLALALAAVMIALGAAGGDLAPLLEFERSRILAGEWWRLITSHFVHLGPLHLAANVAAILAWGYLFDERESLRSILLRLLAAATAVSAGVLIFNAQVAWMLGSSGLIHALVAGSALRLAAGNRRLLGTGVLALVLLKVFAEQALGLASWMESFADYPIASAAHVQGVAVGLIFEMARGHGFMRGATAATWRRWRIH